MRAPRVRVVEDPRLARCGIARNDRRDCFGHGAEVDRDVLGLRHHAPLLVEERGRAVAPLLDVRRERGADQRGAHLLGDRTQSGCDHLQLDRDHDVLPRTSVPCVVGLARPAFRDPGGRAVELECDRAAHGARFAANLDVRRGADLGRPDRDELDLSGVIGVAVAGFVRLVEPLRQIGAKADRELERLPGVAEVGLALRGQLRRPSRAGRRRSAPSRGARPRQRGRAQTALPPRPARARFAGRARPRARTRATAPRRRRRRAQSRAGRAPARPRRP